ncbi:FtsK/SpoIIIE domain-containing protein [Arthrobacter sp. B0490]|uniref:FtsK/SpoIIIE domain-containing protein n=1 Tax=Arthrobacter sp. B0490 TaxID=2058891 RepID=UPI000CE4EB79|nr:FtsK/SpoIIIE domain-containing protein [Arthrobacter sp. B0490]
MDLHVTLASAPPCAFPTREIVVDTLALPTGAALAARLAAAGYRGPFAIDGAPLAAMTACVGSLTDGAIIVCGSSPLQDDAPPMPHLVFVVRSGPDAGQVVPLRRGGYTIGRAACDIVIADPALSRRHALLTVTGNAIVLEDLASVNGTFVDGRRIGTAEVTVSAALRLGGSRCRIELVDGDGWRYVPPADVLAPVQVGREPPRAPSRVLVLTAVLPLVLGIVLAATTGLWFFLAFSALSAVTGSVPLAVHRRNGRVFADALREAAERDRVRRMLAVPDPGQTALDALRACRPVAGGPAAGAQPLAAEILLRIGTADQPANLATAREPAFVPPVLQDLPLVLPCRAGRPGATPGGASEGTSGGVAGESFTITGDPAAVLGSLRALLLQVAHPEQGSPPVVCWGSARHLPVHARFLPNVLLTRDPRVLAGIDRRAGVLLVLQVAEDLPEGARRPDAVVVRFRLDGAGAGHATSGTALPAAGMVMAADGARARIDGREYRVVPDGVSERTFERTARALARAARHRPGTRTRPGPGDGSDVPSSVSLWSGQSGPDTLASSVPGRWAAADARRPTAFVGRSAAGPVAIDLVRDGPHLLVAGTTGSGKSEFLRTLVLGLALDQPPRHLSLLLIDYKGGSGLGALAALPHCVGSLTDLSPESTARALTSLRAELRRRELLCAGHGARDLDGLRRISPATCPARLVVVIDEFRVLGDAVPTAVPDLMRIAALGRSLGVHLVLATQRVQGAVTPELRANITTSVLLRVQTAVESQDLLGSGAAAEIPVDAPGRAFVRRGAEAPVAVQVASPSGLPTADRRPGWQDVAAYLGGAAADPRPGEAAGTPDTEDAGGPPRDPLVEAVAGLAAAARGAAAWREPRPVLPPLPVRLTPTACAGFRPVGPGPSPADAVGVALGIVDLPGRQAQHVLRWHPDSHSHLALVGLPGSGVAEALAAVVASLPGSDPDLHLYVLDGDGTLGRCSADPHVGAYVLPQETRRAGRVLERLAAPGPGGRATGRIVLVVTGWARWSSRFRNGRLARAEDDLQALVRDGARSGVSVLVDGDRDLTTSRFFPLLPNRVYLPLGAHQETTMTWPAMPPIDAVPGRGFAQGPITGGWGDGTCQLVTDRTDPTDLMDPAGAGPVRPPVRTPFPVHPLPREVGLAGIAVAGTPDRLVAGVHGDDLEPFSLALHPGDVYLVLGQRGSGRTNTLRVLAESAGRLIPPRSVLVPPAGAAGLPAPAYWRDVAGGTGPGALDGYILVVDDADRLPADVQQALAGFVARGAACVLSATPGPALLTRVPLALQARAAGRGLVLAPRTAGDGDFFGVRLDTDGEPVAGRGFACDPTGVTEVQIARVSGGTEGPEGIRGPGAADDTPERVGGPYSAFPVTVVRTVYPTTGPEKSVTMTTAAGTRSATPMSGAPMEK